MPDLFPSLNVFEGHWLSSIIIFIIVFGLVAYLFAKDRLGTMVLGFVRTIGSFFYSPFVYLRKIVSQIADYGERGDSELRTSEQYLINKFLIAMRAGLIIVAIAGFALTIVGGWEAMLPPKGLRDAVDSTEELLSKDKKQMDVAVARTQALDNDWQSKRQSLINQYRNERVQKSNAAQSENNQIEASARADVRTSQALDSIRSYLTSNEGTTYAYAIGQTHDVAVQFLDRLGLPDGAKAQLTKYIDNWQTIRTNRLQMDSMSEEQLRAQIQPDYDKVKQESEQLTSQVSYEQKNLESLKSEVKYKPEALLGAFLLGLLGFIITVWMMGLLIEAISLGVVVAGDVRKLREISEKTPEQPRAASVSAGQ